jgi:hypothetical protein
MNSVKVSIFTLLISESRPLSKAELEDLSDDGGEEDSEDFQFGFHTVASSKPKKQFGKTMKIQWGLLIRLGRITYLFLLSDRASD